MLNVAEHRYVRNMPEDAGKLWLYERFAPFGAIQSVKVGCHVQTHMTALLAGHHSLARQLKQRSCMSLT
jgi:hypothetical protein